MVRSAFANTMLGFGLAVALFAAPADAQAHLNLLYLFKGGADGLSPSSGLVFDKQGNLYGTTAAGGGIGCGGFGCGTVFKLTPDGTETLLYSFQGGTNDGYDPNSLIRDSDGNFYGTTLYGGNAGNGGCNNGSCGVVFKLAPDGTETVLHAFSGGDDGANPDGGMVRDKAGNLYGTAENGGTTDRGIVFRIAPDGTETILHEFCVQNCDDGQGPMGNLISDKAGNLYGTTGGGGNGSNGGTVYRLAKDGTLTVLYTFCAQGGQCGWLPEAGVIMDSAGNLYGTTYAGGTGDCPPTSGCGTVFELSPDGTETELHSFDPSVDGELPVAGVIMDKAGNLYGAVGGSAAPKCRGKPGVVFRLTPQGKETIYCIPSGVAAGVIERGGAFYGAGTGQGTYKHAAGFIFQLKN